MRVIVQNAHLQLYNSITQSLWSLIYEFLYMRDIEKQQAWLEYRIY